ncbi:MAG TPA: hypothetical protein VGG16_19300 [Streptosporangiaceae bacterium]|jgi:hypothetical protein
MLFPAALLEPELELALDVEVGALLELELEQAVRLAPSTARADTATIRVE